MNPEPLLSGPQPQTVRLHPADDVVVAVAELPAGTVVAAEALTTRETIPAGHKVTTRALPAGAPVRKYNQVIGFTSAAVAPGCHLHTHNLGVRDFARDYAFCADRREPPAPAEAWFEGIRRADGRIATRNYLGVIATVNCAATVARKVAEVLAQGRLGAFPHVDGVVPLTHSSGCGMNDRGEGMELLRRTLAGYARHANFAGVLVLGLGCEANQIEGLLERVQPGPGALVAALTIQEAGGTVKTVREAVARLEEMLPVADQARRERVSARHLRVGLQCGGSDGYSGLTANPALGAAVDRLVACGGSAILSETPEIYGAEHLLTRRAERPETAEKLVARIRWWEEYTARHHAEMNNNPSPGNKAGGLTTILEKSLGAVAKGGTTNLREVYGYAEPVSAAGLVFMDTPGYDPVSATGQVAGGANLICFSTGRGSVYGCKPVPSLKLATHSALYRRMEDDMDVNCGEILDGTASAQDVGDRIFEAMLATASGRPSRSEAHGFGVDEFVPWTLGAVM